MSELITADGQSFGLFFGNVREHSPECIAHRASNEGGVPPRRLGGPHAFVEVMVRGKYQAGERNSAAIAAGITAETEIFVTPGQVRGVIRAFEKADGALSEFQQLPAVAEAFRAAGHHFKFECDDASGVVTKIAVIFAGAAEFCSSRAFTGILFLDGAHMISPGVGVQLNAVTQTGDRKVLALGVGWAMTETKEGYVYLLNALRECGIVPARFISDKAKGILTGIRAVFPDAIAIPCWLHSIGNVKVARARDMQWALLHAITRENFVERLTRFSDTYP